MQQRYRKSKKYCSFDGIFHIRDVFSVSLTNVIDKVLGQRGETAKAYKYSEIFEGTVLQLSLSRRRPRGSQHQFPQHLYILQSIRQGGWFYRGRQWILNLYTGQPYEMSFQHSIGNLAGLLLLSILPKVNDYVWSPSIIRPSAYIYRYTRTDGLADSTNRGFGGFAKAI